MSASQTIYKKYAGQSRKTVVSISLLVLTLRLSNGMESPESIGSSSMFSSMPNRSKQQVTASREPTPANAHWEILPARFPCGTHDNHCTTAKGRVCVVGGATHYRGYPALAHVHDELLAYDPGAGWGVVGRAQATSSGLFLRIGRVAQALSRCPTARIAWRTGFEFPILRSLLGQSEAPLYRGRRYRGRCNPLPKRRPWFAGRRQLSASRYLQQDPYGGKPTAVRLSPPITELWSVPGEERPSHCH